MSAPTTPPPMTAFSSASLVWGDIRNLAWAMQQPGIEHNGDSFVSAVVAAAAADPPNIHVAHGFENVGDLDVDLDADPYVMVAAAIEKTTMLVVLDDGGPRAVTLWRVPASFLAEVTTATAGIFATVWVDGPADTPIMPTPPVLTVDTGEVITGTDGHRLPGGMSLDDHVSNTLIMASTILATGPETTVEPPRAMRRKAETRVGPMPPVVIRTPNLS